MVCSRGQGSTGAEMNRARSVSRGCSVVVFDTSRSSVVELSVGQSVCFPRLFWKLVGLEGRRKQARSFVVKKRSKGTRHWFQPANSACLKRTRLLTRVIKFWNTFCFYFIYKIHHTSVPDKRDMEKKPVSCSTLSLY